MDEVKTPSTSGEAVEMAMMHLRSVQQFAAYDQMPEANLNLSVAQVYATLANALPGYILRSERETNEESPLPLDATLKIQASERGRLRQLYRDAFELDDEYFPSNGMEDAADTIISAEERIFGPSPTD